MDSIHNSFNKFKKIPEEQEVMVVTGNLPQDNEDNEDLIEVDISSYIESTSASKSKVPLKKMIKTYRCPYRNKRYKGRHKCGKQCWGWKEDTLILAEDPNKVIIIDD